MYNLTVEHRKLSDDLTLSKNLANHIATRYMEGSIAIIAKRPASLMASVKRQWITLIKNPRSRYATNLSFSARSPSEEPVANVLFSTAREFKVVPPICRTLYVTCEIDQQNMYMITSWMPPHSLVVIYKL